MLKADYQQLMRDPAAKRTSVANALTAKASAKADREADWQAHIWACARGARCWGPGKVRLLLYAVRDWLLQKFVPGLRRSLAKLRQ